MILDGHMHMNAANIDKVAFMGSMKNAGVDGGVVISRHPETFELGGSKADFLTRLNGVLSVAASERNLFPFFWIDPLEDNAVGQVKQAVSSGISGFKVICDRFYPGDPRPMEVFRAISAFGKPILFHSGILWDGKASSEYNRPCGFEALTGITGLKFCLAHISWPWVDECLAVYGKLLNAKGKRKEPSAEMFIDMTPGTPPIYREETLKKLFTIGYDVADNVIFGTDSLTDDYSTGKPGEIIKRDGEIYSNIGLAENIIDKIYCGNLLRFVGHSKPM